MLIDNHDEWNFRPLQEGEDGLMCVVVDAGGETPRVWASPRPETCQRRHRKAMWLFYPRAGGWAALVKGSG